MLSTATGCSVVSWTQMDCLHFVLKRKEFPATKPYRATKQGTRLRRLEKWCQRTRKRVDMELPILVISINSYLSSSRSWNDDNSLD